MKKRGFTLIELMVVIAIIGLLAAIALPKFGDVASQAKVANVQGNISSLRTSIAMFYATDGDYPDLAAHESDLTGADGTDTDGTGIDFTDFYNKTVMPDTPTKSDGTAATNNTVEIATATTSGTEAGGWNYVTTDGTILANLPTNAYGQGTVWSEQ